jgi:hypothetical protein
VNIANFALGRDSAGAVGVVNVDESGASRVDEQILAALEAVPAIKEARVVRV